MPRVLRTVTVTAAIIAAVTVFTGTAAARWSGAGTGVGDAATTDLTPASISAPSTGTNSVTITWTSQGAVTSAPAAGPVTYVVERRLNGGGWVPVLAGACAGDLPKPTTACTDTVTAAGTWMYRTVTKFATWTAVSNEVTVVVALDTTNPSASLALAGTSPSNAASRSWTVTFSEPVTGVDASDFALATTGTVAGASITSVTGTGATRTVTVATGTGTGNLGLNLVDDDTIRDGGDNPLGGTGAGNGNVTGPAYAMDRTPPSASITRASPTPTNVASVSWTVTFSESVTGVDTTDFTLASTVSGASITGVSGTGTTRTVTASTGTGSGTLRLDLVDDDSVQDAVTNPLGGPGNGNGNVTGPAYTIDRTAPVLTELDMLDVDGDGKVDRVDATFDEPLAPTTATTPPWTLSNVPSGGTLASVSATGSTVTLALNEGAGAANTAVGTFTVALAASATGVRDTLGNQASFTARAPADAAGPSLVTAFDGSGSVDGLFQAGDSLTATFSEPLLAASIPTSLTVTLARAATGNATVDITGFTAGARDLGATGYLNGPSRSAVFPATRTVSTATVVVTLGTCSSGCGNLATQATAANVSLAIASTVQDAALNGAVSSRVLTFPARVF